MYHSIKYSYLFSAYYKLINSEMLKIKSEYFKNRIAMAVFKGKKHHLTMEKQIKNVGLWRLETVNGRILSNRLRHEFHSLGAWYIKLCG